MKRMFSVLSMLVFTAGILSAMDAKEIVDRMEKAMDVEDAYLHAYLENTDRFGTLRSEFDTYRNADGDTLLIVTDGPDRGQKILRLSDDIYIYYPDADETIRLSSSGLKESFLGSDFSYEDLTGNDEFDERYDYSLEGTEDYNGISCYRILFNAKSLSETYQKQEVLVDCERFVPLRSRLFSRSGKLLKEIFYDRYVETDGIIYPTYMKVENSVKKDNYSTVTILEFDFDGEIDDGLFSKEELSW